MQNKPQYKYTKIMTGRTWANENKASDKDPDMTGNMVKVRTLEAANGDYNLINEKDKYAVSVWKNKDKTTGKVYISFSVSSKEEITQGQKVIDDDLPF